MTRSGKTEERPSESSGRHISVEDFIYTRDNVLNGLSKVQAAIQELSRACITHTNNILAKGSGSPLELFNLTVPILNENTLFGAPIDTPRPIQIQGPSGGQKKKRAHDKNAPKRPITPYFLYMQTQRSKIARELDPSHSAKDVADEGTRRWNEMPPEEKEYWSYQYGINFARYKQKVKAYKAGEPIPEISDTEAKKLFDKEKNNGSITERLLSHAELEQTEDHLESESSISTSSEEPPVSPKDPSPPRSSKRRKIDRDQPVKQPSPPPQLSMKGPDPDSDESASIVVEKRNKRPVRKREPKEADENLGSGDLVPTVAISSKRSSDNFSKPKRSKRKRKSENFDS